MTHAKQYDEYDLEKKHDYKDNWLVLCKCNLCLVFIIITILIIMPTYKAGTQKIL
jgi:hypothetical protein